MKFALACYGSRGDVEPSAAVGRELQRRGHEVRMAVPPELVGFVETVGLPAIPFGPELQCFDGVAAQPLGEEFPHCTIRIGPNWCAKLGSSLPDLGAK